MGSRPIRVDSEVYRRVADCQEKLMLATGKHVSMTKALSFIIALRTPLKEVATN